MSDMNPYQSPSSVATVPEWSPEQLRIGRNIRAICILYMILGSIAVLAGAGLLLERSGEVSPPVALLVAALGLAGVVSAAGVLGRRAWGIPFCQIVSGLYLLSFPIGTILGGYFLLNIGKVRTDFQRRANAGGDL